MKKKNIVITNDDGIFGAGLTPLIQEIQQIANVITVVPDQERSATSHYLTVRDIVRCKPVSEHLYALTGTPADCARFGILELGKRDVDLVISGINYGQNMGQDVIYSGTVAAAREAVLLRVPGIAVSLATKTGEGFPAAAAIARKLAQFVLAGKKLMFLNVNVPDLPPGKIRGIRVTSLGTKTYEDRIQSRLDPHGLPYYWIKSNQLPENNKPGTDVHTVKNGMVSITPLTIDSTDYPSLLELKTNLENLL